MTQTDRARMPHPVGCAKHRGKDGARAMMTPKQKIKVHAEIERENRRKIDEWKKGGKKA